MKILRHATSVLLGLVVAVLIPMTVAPPASATTGTTGMTCSSIWRQLTHHAGQNNIETLSGVCTDGPSGTVYRLRVQFCDYRAENCYWRNSVWADYCTTSICNDLTVWADKPRFAPVQSFYQWSDTAVAA